VFIARRIWRATRLCLSPQSLLDEIFPAVALLPGHLGWAGGPRSPFRTGEAARGTSFAERFPKNLKCPVGPLAESDPPFHLDSGAKDLLHQNLDAFGRLDDERRV